MTQYEKNGNNNEISDEVGVLLVFQHRIAKCASFTF